MDPRQSFEHLLRPHLRGLHRLAFRLTGNSADADDLLQDVLVRLFERAVELKAVADLAPWTRRVLYNRFVDQRRRTRKFRLGLVRIGNAADASAPDTIDEQSLRSTAPGPEHEAALAFDVRRMDAALARLSDEHRVVVLLHDAEGVSMEEIAAMKPLGTVKSRLHRARARLRELFGDGTFSS
jgi:RNA polymerase sigma factor (sigma-70 family)